MIAAMNAVLDALTINPERALEELENDWTASMELAEALQMDNKVPFRVGHSFASSIVTHARSIGLAPRDFPYCQGRGARMPRRRRSTSCRTRRCP